MLSIIDWSSLSAAERTKSLQRPIGASSCQADVARIIKRVQTQGDHALRQLTQQFDGVKLKQIQVSKTEIQLAHISTQALEAIEQAITMITNYHQATRPKECITNTAEGVTITTTYRPIQRVGLYVPGGNNTPLISSLLMQAIPALVAGCPIKTVCTPPNKHGTVDPHLLVAGRLCGIDEMYCVGGAQAIAAMAYGTEHINKVDKLFGPGNSYVTEAKSQVAKDPLGAAIDMPAGPSEVMISADNTANPVFVASDLLAQAEHGADSQVILLCEDRLMAQQVNHEVKVQIGFLSRSSLIKASLAKSKIIVCSTEQEQLKIINDYAPEHLILNRANAALWVNEIHAVGTVFLGPWAAETLGDYLTGSNHVLPTNGYARCYNGLSTLDFMTRFTIQNITIHGLRALGQAALTLAHLEGLDAHARAVELRLQSLEG